MDVEKKKKMFKTITKKKVISRIQVRSQNSLLSICGREERFDKYAKGENMGMLEYKKCAIVYEQLVSSKLIRNSNLKLFSKWWWGVNPRKQFEHNCYLLR